MSRQIIFDAEARLEFEEAVIWYDAQQPELGDRFEAEVHVTFQNILHNPERFPLVAKKTRKAGVGGFSKYKVFSAPSLTSLASFPFFTAAAIRRNCGGG